ncbi:hypothetical protein QAD02_018500 [Eretmocerus hayati]|uniref:Uncharacterized protein n=1 Tax=Eretmocerus hayati TaxID=131215 RepID=A0ACC2PI33_9HYME|nr:hypothetical protein QAD02_018500 [Eretmocerus hayati]
MDLETLNSVYDNEYLKINKILQELTGLWPFGSKKQNFIRRVIALSTLSIIIMPCLNALRVWCGKDLGICSENICGSLYVMACFSKYLVTVLNEGSLKILYEHVAAMWLSIKDPNEKELMIKYAKSGHLKTVGYCAYLGLAAVGFSQFTMYPVFLDIIKPLNGSRQKLLFVKAEYGVDPFEHYYKIYAAYCIATIVSALAFMAIDTTYTAIVHQNLGVFGVVRYRLRIATQIPPHDSQDYAYNTIVSAIKLHEKSLEFIKLIDSSYSILFLILILQCVIFMAFGMVTIMENMSEPIDLIRMVLFQIGVAVHLFYMNWPGQLVVNESSKIHLAAYQNQWYAIPERAKRLLKIMMIRTTRPSRLSAAGFYDMNFENYGSIIKSTLSYSAVLASFRE